MATYVNNLRLKEITTGDESGTWGTSTNTNLELIGEALGYGTEAITTNADTHASTVADGSTDQARAMYLKYTGTLDSTCTITIGPNTMKRFQIIENATSGSQSIIISQGSGANVTIAAGGVKVVYLDGAGSGAAVVDAFVDLDVGGTFTVGTAANGVSITNGAIDLKNSGSASYMRFYCESSNAHYAEIKSAAHSAYSGNVTLTLPVTTSNLVGDSATQTLTNKTINASNNTLSNIPMSATSFSAGTGVTLSTNTLNVDAAQTGITSLLATDIKIGEDDETKIDFEDANEINFYADNEKKMELTSSGLALIGTTPSLTIGDAGAEDTKIVFDGNAQDFYIGLDDTADDLLIGLGSTVGTTPAIHIDENQVVTFDAGTSGEYTAVTSSSAAVSLNLQLGDNFSHDLTEDTTVSFANPAASGKVSVATLRIIQGSTARTITWHSSIKWAGDTAPTLSTGDDEVDIFVFYTVDGGTNYYGFTAGQDMS